MQLSIRYSIAFTVFIFILAHIGFYKKYIALFPTFNDTTGVTHYHATLMFLWLAMLVVQPFLILNKKVEWHRLIGKASYIVAPLLVISMFLITNQGYLSKLKRMTEVEALANLSVNIPDFFAFALLYGLAIYYRKNTDWHARFMIATIFPIIGAAIVRILMRNFGMASPMAFSIVMYLSDVMCLIFLVADLKSKKYQPYLIALIILIVEQLIYIGRYTDTWQSFAKWYIAKFIH
jgi:hypothetical protein